MGETIMQGTALETAFWCSAVAGTLFFILKALMMILGGVDDVQDMDAGDLAHEGTDASDVAFKLLSINSLTGFFMMFGWAGLAGLKEFQIGEFASFAVAFAIGLLSMYITASLFRGARLLVSPGSQFSIDKTVGLRATVYQMIPGNGTGQIQVAVEGVTREIDAVSEQKEDIRSQQSVEVVRVVDDRTVSVRGQG